MGPLQNGREDVRIQLIFLIVIEVVVNGATLRDLLVVESRRALLANSSRRLLLN